MSRVLVAHPLVAFPRLEQRTEIRRGKDERPAGFGHTGDLVDGFFGIRQMLNDMFDDDHVERTVRKWKFLRGGSFQRRRVHDRFGFFHRPVVEIHAEGLEGVLELANQMSHARADFQ